ncbi:hypothetical protein OG875_19460 [Streptomyces sp. NBC_01498]|uniref:hypothetical protein n=1 Tax=Streptomyces sp. NBC_01498 TaxID=2975870 RepID=UPI002E7B8307|nr:hypothetical protein [Streptomyces sp. NBC_01498]WTL26554.1 hypothetical protein OG875_19460 [Streptomyces sp. NBC_01498]
MTTDLAGSTALIGGAISGTGRAAARLAALGALVFVSVRAKSAAQPPWAGWKSSPSVLT